MPIARYQLPNGKIARFEVPVGTTPDQVEQMANEHFGTSFQPQQSNQTVKTISDIISPIVETGAMVGGGLMGLPLGPAGAAAGGVLGYAAGKQATRGVNQYLGLEEAPATLGQAAKTAAGDVVTGAAYEAVGGATGKLIGKVAPPIADLFSGNIAKVRAGKIIRAAAGKNLPAIKQANKVAPKGVTSAQAAYGVQQDPYQALNKLVSHTDPDSYYRSLGEKQKREVMDLLAKAAGGSNQTEAMAARNSSKASLTGITDPLRRQAMDAAGNAAENGHLPLHVKPILDEITSKVKDPSLAGDEQSRMVLNKIYNLIKGAADQNGGVISPEALYSIRKDGVNNAIEGLLGSSDPKYKAKKTAALVTKLKPVIDQVFEDAGASLKPYLETYEKGAHEISKKELGAKAMALYDKSPKSFVGLVEGKMPKTVEKIFGPGKFDINAQMAEDIVPLRKASDLTKRDIEIAEQATAGTSALSKIIKENQLTARLPALFNHSATVANKTIDYLEGKVNGKTLDILREGMKSGKNANDLINFLPANERIKTLRALDSFLKSNPGLVGKGAAVNAFTPDAVKNAFGKKQENQNALFR